MHILQGLQELAFLRLDDNPLSCLPRFPASVSFLLLDWWRHPPTEWRTCLRLGCQRAAWDDSISVAAGVWNLQNLFAFTRGDGVRPLDVLMVKWSLFTVINGTRRCSCIGHDICYDTAIFQPLNPEAWAPQLPSLDADGWVWHRGERAVYQRNEGTFAPFTQPTWE
eukprot:2386187-Rhodomonas_salina.1